MARAKNQYHYGDCVALRGDRRADYVVMKAFSKKGVAKIDTYCLSDGQEETYLESDVKFVRKQVRNGRVHTKESAKMGRMGEEIVSRIVNGVKTPHKAPFDIVDFGAGIAYEVKSRSGVCKGDKIHIEKKSLKRKIAFAHKYRLKMVLFVVIIWGPERVEVFKGRVKEHVYVSQMKKVAS